MDHELAMTEAEALAAMQGALGIPDLVSGPGWVTQAEMCQAWHMSENTMRKLLAAKLKAGLLEKGNAIREDTAGREYRAEVYRPK